MEVQRDRQRNRQTGRQTARRMIRQAAGGHIADRHVGMGITHNYVRKIMP